MDGKGYLNDVLHEFRRLKSLGDAAIRQVPEGRFFEGIDPFANSIAILLKHLAGNLRSRWTDFLTSDGEKPDRNRDLEFEIVSGGTKERLLHDWENGWSTLFDTLSSLAPADLERHVTIRGEPHTVVEAINRQLTHYGYHVGQIVLLSKHWAGEQWKTLSIPKGKSHELNVKAKPYKREV